MLAPAPTVGNSRSTDETTDLVLLAVLEVSGLSDGGDVAVRRVAERGADPGQSRLPGCAGLDQPKRHGCTTGKRHTGRPTRTELPEQSRLLASDVPSERRHRHANRLFHRNGFRLAGQ